MGAGFFQTHTKAMKLLIHIILKSLLLTIIGVAAYLIFINFIA